MWNMLKFPQDKVFQIQTDYIRGEKELVDPDNILKQQRTDRSIAGPKMNLFAALTELKMRVPHSAS